jgi:hypothetical protein
MGEDAATVAGTGDRLTAVVEAASPRLRGIGDADAGVSPRPGAWCPKEVMGHLIDSAANNHQRFVRGQLAAELVLPGYEQDRWVSVQGYGEARWTDLVELWRLYNLRLAEVIRRIPPARLSTPCRLGAGEPVTLGFIVKDYLRHVEHHLGQIRGLEA